MDGWLNIIWFVLIGATIGIFLNAFKTAGGKVLRQDFIALGNLAGLSLDEIKSKVGAPSAMSSCTVADTGKQGTLYTWAKDPYSITLLFDENNICLGVNQEITGD